MKIPIASDHAGFDMKQHILQHLSNKYDFEDLGVYTPERADYPDYAKRVVNYLVEHSENKNLEQESPVKTKGILLCGSGNGMQMTANKYPFIRAALCWNEEIAKLARQHNDANILVLPARFIEAGEVYKCVDAFFSTEFEGGRHLERVKKING
ncbi:ribose 5-phosphate isomerase B [Bacteroidia bacterium]|nr:ribose 5-phosphate isomerase B [Bacteroidia bacterium]